MVIALLILVDCLVVEFVLQAGGTTLVSFSREISTKHDFDLLTIEDTTFAGKCWLVRLVCRLVSIELKLIGAFE